jgi:hypothetical protein
MMIILVQSRFKSCKLRMGSSSNNISIYDDIKASLKDLCMKALCSWV